MRRQRIIMMVSGALVSLCVVTVSAFLLLAPKRVLPLAGCQRSTLIRPMYVCGSSVMYRNPDGSIVRIGQAEDLTVPHTHPALNSP